MKTEILKIRSIVSDIDKIPRGRLLRGGEVIDDTDGSRFTALGNTLWTRKR